MRRVRGPRERLPGRRAAARGVALPESTASAVTGATNPPPTSPGRQAGLIAGPVNKVSSTVSGDRGAARGGQRGRGGRGEVAEAGMTDHMPRSSPLPVGEQHVAAADQRDGAGRPRGPGTSSTTRVARVESGPRSDSTATAVRILAVEAGTAARSARPRQQHLTVGHVDHLGGHRASERTGVEQPGQCLGQPRGGRRGGDAVQGRQHRTGRRGDRTRRAAPRGRAGDLVGPVRPGRAGGRSAPCTIVRRPSAPDSTTATCRRPRAGPGRPLVSRSAHPPIFTEFRCNGSHLRGAQVCDSSLQQPRGRSRQVEFDVTIEIPAGPAQQVRGGPRDRPDPPGPDALHLDPLPPRLRIHRGHPG